MAGLFFAEDLLAAAFFAAAVEVAFDLLEAVFAVVFAALVFAAVFFVVAAALLVLEPSVLEVGRCGAACFEEALPVAWSACSVIAVVSFVAKLILLSDPARTRIAQRRTSGKGKSSTIGVNHLARTIIPATRPFFSRRSAPNSPFPAVCRTYPVFQRGADNRCQRTALIQSQGAQRIFERFGLAHPP